MYRNRESAGCFNTTNFLAKLNDWQATRPERVWVADTQRKYLRPYEDNETETYIPMLAGRKNHQREQVKTYNAYYFASKYVSDFCTSQNVMVRGNTPTSGTSITVVPPRGAVTMSMYINCYIVVASTSYNVVAKTKAQRGQTYTMDFSATVGNMGETELYFCSAPMITGLGNLAQLYFKQNNFAMGTNIQRLEIGSSLTGYSNPNLETLTIGNNKMLEYLDVRNCPNVTGALDLTGCVSLSEVYLENTAFTGVAFATGGLLTTAHINNPTSLTMRELKYLTDLTLTSASAISALRIEDCDIDDAAVLTIAGTSTTQASKDFIINLVDSSPNISRVRFGGVDWTFTGTSTLDALLTLGGIDDNSYDIEQSYITGSAYVPTMRSGLLSQYNAAWPYLTISYGTMVTQYAASFYNADGTTIKDLHGNDYVQWVDSGSAPYDPITKDYNITIRDSGTPTANEYAASSYNNKYYLDVSTGVIYLSNGTTWSSVDTADVLTPSMASTAQYTYTYTGWDNMTSMAQARTITAQYTSTARTYTVNWYAYTGNILETRTGIPYGACVDYSAGQITLQGYGAPATAGYTAASNSGKYYQNLNKQRGRNPVYYSDGSTWTQIDVEDLFVTPTWTDGESQNIYHVFMGWDRSTGNIVGDTNVYALWSTQSGSPAVGTDLWNMTYAQIYGVGQMGLQDTYWEDKDYFDFEMGNDFDFDTIGLNGLTTSTPGYVAADVLGEDIILSGVPKTKGTFGGDIKISDGYTFDGSTAVTTNLTLFDENDPSFTMAIDFQFFDTTTNNTLISANTSGTEYFRLQYNSAPTITWGDQSMTVGYATLRDLIVIRHIAGDANLHVYFAGASGSGNTGSYLPDGTTATARPTTNLGDYVYRKTLTRTSNTTTSEPLSFGGVAYGNGYRYNGNGVIHWMKIWYDDIGDTNAYKLAAWCHEKSRVEYWGANKYYYWDSNNTSKASFVFNNEFADRGHPMNTSNTNVGGWKDSYFRTFANSRVFKGLPIGWRSLIQDVEIVSTIGDQSTSTSDSSNKVYLQSYREVGSGSTTAGYISEVGTSTAPIPWYTTNPTRLKWRGRLHLDDATIYTGSTEPSVETQTIIYPGDIWVNTGNSSIGYIFVSQDELDEYKITPYASADPTYAEGGWVSANYWWERSPNLSNSTIFMSVHGTGYPGNNSSATNAHAFSGGFSI